MGKSLSELNLKEETLPTAGESLDNLPQFGQFAPPPQPGAFRFRLPNDLTRIWDTFEAPNKTPATRVSAQFDAQSPLLIIQSPGGRYDNEPFQTKLNNNERPRGKDKMLASDLDYLIAAIEGPKTPKPTSNAGYLQKVQTYRGKEFGADIRWSWRCGENPNIRVKNDAGDTVEVPDKKGCGESYYQEDVENLRNPETREWPLEISCKCGAVLRAFGNIDNIRA